MKLLSIDVGIKNLAFCLFEIIEQKTTILKWEVIDIAESETFNCMVTESNNKCDKPAKYKKNLNYYCLKHAKKQTFQIPKFDFNPKKVSSQKIATLYEIADNYQIQYQKPIKKSYLEQSINEYIHDNYLQVIEKQNGNSIDLITIGMNIQKKFDHILNDQESIDYVIIENQISSIANRMKSIQGMLVQFFIMSKIFVDRIEFISAANKLKECNLPQKTTYTERKKLSIAKCLEIIKEYNTDFLGFFMNHSKKDDLADCFLQGRWYIREKMN
jgi:hypothetical protein